MAESPKPRAPRLPDIDWPVDVSGSQPNGGPPVPSTATPVMDPVYVNGGSKALCSIAARAFVLGTAFGISTFLTIWFAYHDSGVWKGAHFVSVLSLFHFLEFYATARYNPADAKLSSFLLSANGSAYNIAHASAMLEFSIRVGLRSIPALSGWQLPFSVSEWLPNIPSEASVILGLALELVGQTVRTVAMAEAGKSFNHVVQSRKRDDHVLIKSGIYRYLRHPSYFGFFWWGLGTQLVLGNPICFLAYGLVLWKFFSSRIAKEEPLLIKFFGEEYRVYRQQTPVLIPLIG